MKVLRNGSPFCLATVLILASQAFAAERSDGPWKSLFDGKTLDGWEVREGEGKFFVDDGAIVGETTAGVKGSYLCTKESFDNFVLELEFKVDEGLNSGVHIRSAVHEQETTTLYLSGAQARAADLPGRSAFQNGVLFRGASRNVWENGTVGR